MMASREHSPIRSSHLAAHQRRKQQQQAVHYYHQQSHQRGIVSTPTSTTVYTDAMNMNERQEISVAWKGQAPKKERDTNSGLSFGERNDMQRAQQGEVSPILDHHHDHEVVGSRHSQASGVEVLHVPAATTNTKLELALPKSTIFCYSGLTGYNDDDNTSTGGSSKHSYMDDDTTATTVVAKNTSKTKHNALTYRNSNSSLSNNMKVFMKSLAKRIMIKESPANSPALPTIGSSGSMHNKNSHPPRGRSRSKSIDSSSLNTAYRTPTHHASRRSTPVSTPPTWESKSPPGITTFEKRDHHHHPRVQSSKSWDVTDKYATEIEDDDKDLYAVASVPVATTTSPLRRTGLLFPTTQDEGGGKKKQQVLIAQQQQQADSNTYHQMVLLTKSASTNSGPVDLDETPPDESFSWLDQPYHAKNKQECAESVQSQEVSERSYYLQPSTRNLNDTFLDVPYQGPVDLDVTVDSVMAPFTTTAAGKAKVDVDDDSLVYAGPLHGCPSSDMGDENHKKYHRDDDDDQRRVPTLAPHLVTPRKAAKHRRSASAGGSAAQQQQQSSSHKPVELEDMALASETINQPFLTLRSKEEYGNARKRPAAESLSVAMMSSASMTSNITSAESEDHVDLDTSMTSTSSHASFVQQEVQKWNTICNSKYTGPVDLDDSIASELCASKDDGRDFDMSQDVNVTDDEMKEAYSTSKSRSSLPKVHASRSPASSASRPPLLPPPYHDSRKISSIFGLPSGTTNAEALQRAQRRNCEPVDLDDTIVSENEEEEDASGESTEEGRAGGETREDKAARLNNSMDNIKPPSMLGQRSRASNQSFPKAPEQDPQYSTRLDMSSIDKSLNGDSGAKEMSTRSCKSVGFGESLSETVDETHDYAEDSFHVSGRSAEESCADSSYDDESETPEEPEGLPAPVESSAVVAQRTPLLPVAIGTKQEQTSQRQTIQKSPNVSPQSSHLTDDVRLWDNDEAEQPDQENLAPRNLKEDFEGNALAVEKSIEAAVADVQGSPHEKEALERLERQLEVLESQMQKLELTQDSNFAAASTTDESKLPERAQANSVPGLHPSPRDSPPVKTSLKQQNRRSPGPVDLDVTVNTLNTTMSLKQQKTRSTGPVDLDVTVDTLNTTTGTTGSVGAPGLPPAKDTQRAKLTLSSKIQADRRRSTGPVDLDVTVDSMSTTASEVQVPGGVLPSTQRTLPASRPPRLPPSTFDSRPKRLQRSKQQQFCLTIQEEADGSNPDPVENVEDKQEHCTTRGFEAIFDHLEEPPVSNSNSPETECAKISPPSAEKPKPRSLNLSPDWYDGILQDDGILWPDAPFLSTPCQGNDDQAQVPSEKSLSNEANRSLAKLSSPRTVARPGDQDWRGYISDSDEDLASRRVPLRSVRSSPTVSPQKRATSIEKPTHSWADDSSDEDNGNLSVNQASPKVAPCIHQKPPRPSPAKRSNKSPDKANGDHWESFGGVAEVPQKIPFCEYSSPSPGAVKEPSVDAIDVPGDYDEVAQQPSFDVPDSPSDELSRSQQGYFPSIPDDKFQVDKSVEISADEKQSDSNNISYDRESTASSSWEPEWFDFEKVDEKASAETSPSKEEVVADPAEANSPTGSSEDNRSPAKSGASSSFESYESGSDVEIAAKEDMLVRIQGSRPMFRIDEGSDSSGNSLRPCVLGQEPYRQGYSAVMDELESCSQPETSVVQGSYDDSTSSSKEMEPAHENKIYAIENEIRLLEDEIARLQFEDAAGSSSGEALNESGIVAMEKKIAGLEAKAAKLLIEQLYQSLIGDGEATHPSDEFSDVKDLEETALPTKMKLKLPPNKTASPTSRSAASPRDTYTVPQKDEAMDDLCQRLSFELLREGSDGESCSPRKTRKKLASDRVGIRRMKARLLGTLSQLRTSPEKRPGKHGSNANVMKQAEELLTQLSIKSKVVDQINHLCSPSCSPAKGQNQQQHLSPSPPVKSPAKSTRPPLSPPRVAEANADDSVTGIITSHSYKPFFSFEADFDVWKAEQEQEESPTKSMDGDNDARKDSPAQSVLSADKSLGSSSEFVADFSRCESVSYVSMKSPETSLHSNKSLDSLPHHSLARPALLTDFDKEPQVVMQLNFDHALKKIEQPQRLCPETVSFDEQPKVLTVVPLVTESVVDEEEEVIGRIFLGDFIDESVGLEMEADIDPPANAQTTDDSATDATVKPVSKQVSAVPGNGGRSVAADKKAIFNPRNDKSAAQCRRERSPAKPDPEISGSQVDSPDRKAPLKISPAENQPLEPIEEVVLPAHATSLAKGSETSKFDHRPASIDCVGALADSSMDSSDDGGDPSGYVLEDTLDTLQSEESLQFIDAPSSASSARVREIPVVETVGYEEEFSDEELEFSRPRKGKKVKNQDTSPDHCRNTSKEWLPEAGLADFSASLHDLTEESISTFGAIKDFVSDTLKPLNKGLKIPHIGNKSKKKRSPKRNTDVAIVTEAQSVECTLEMFSDSKRHIPRPNSSATARSSPSRSSKNGAGKYHKLTERSPSGVSEIDSYYEANSSYDSSNAGSLDSSFGFQSQNTQSMSMNSTQLGQTYSLVRSDTPKRKSRTKRATSGHKPSIKRTIPRSRDPAGIMVSDVVEL